MLDIAALPGLTRAERVPGARLVARRGCSTTRSPARPPPGRGAARRRRRPAPAASRCSPSAVSAAASCRRTAIWTCVLVHYGRRRSPRSPMPSGTPSGTPGSGSTTPSAPSPRPAARLHRPQGGPRAARRPPGRRRRRARAPGSWNRRPGGLAQPASRRLPAAAGPAWRTGRAQVGELAFLLEPDLKESYGGLREVRSCAPSPPPGWRRAAPPRSRRPTPSCSTCATSCAGAPAARATSSSARSSVRSRTSSGCADDGRPAARGQPRGPPARLRHRRDWRRVEAAPRRGGPRGRLPARSAASRWPRVSSGRATRSCWPQGARPAADPVLLLRAAAAAARAGLLLSPYTLKVLAVHSPPMPEPWPRGASAGRSCGCWPAAGRRSPSWSSWTRRACCPG